MIELNKSEILKALIDWNKHAEELFLLSIVDKLEHNKVTISAKMGQAVIVNSDFPDEEAIKAGINDLRRFFQKGNDALRIYKLIEIYNSSSIIEIERKDFNYYISEYDKFKVAKTFVILEGKPLTNSEVLEVFLYGKYSHRSKDPKEIYDTWEKDPLLFPILKSEFLHSLGIQL
ncbi:MAG: hypothetical protein PHR26_04165, partial [Candidatus ainarchaeum sp.]|nr:hypothetical protein [Candidatus ainarchaeum sp.]